MRLRHQCLSPSSMMVGDCNCDLAWGLCLTGTPGRCCTIADTTNCMLITLAHGGGMAGFTPLSIVEITDKNTLLDIGQLSLESPFVIYCLFTKDYCIPLINFQILASIYCFLGLVSDNLVTFLFIMLVNMVSFGFEIYENLWSTRNHVLCTIHLHIRMDCFHLASWLVNHSSNTSINVAKEILLCTGLVETDPEGALSGFAEVVRMEPEKAEW